MSAQLREELHGPVGVIVVDRPPVNAYNAEIRDGIVAAVERFDADPAVRAIVLTATGKAFSGGQDLEEFDVEATGGIPYAIVQSFDGLCDLLASCPTPTIAAVNGSAIGGGLEVVLSCDLRLAAPTARFAAVGAQMGIISSTQRLVRVVGEPQAKLLAFTARRVDAAEAHRIGLVHEVVPGEELLQRAIALGEEIAATAPLSIVRAKHAINHAADMPLADGLRLQRDFCRELSQTEDHREAVRAFRERRAPQFRNR